MKTRAFFEKYKGYPTFSVWEVDEAGEKVGAYPLFSMGTKKAVALAQHLEQFKDFVKIAETTKEGSNAKTRRDDAS